MSKIPASVEDEVARHFDVRDVVYYEDRVEFLLKDLSPTETGSPFRRLYERLSGLGLVPKLFRDDNELKLLVFQATWRPINIRLRYSLLAVTLGTIAVSAWIVSDGTASLMSDLGIKLDVATSILLHLLGIVVFLLLHELGHSLRWRGKYSVDLLIPAPPPPLGFGTLGDLLIRERPFINREEAVEVSLNGLLLGLLAGLVISFVGLLQSIPVSSDVVNAWIREGKAGMLPTPLAFMLLEILLSPGGGRMLLLSPLALSGLGALLITFYIAMPVLPWDGGHLASSLSGGRKAWLEWMVVIGMILVNPLMGAMMLVAKLLPSYPPPLDEYSEIPVPKRRRGLLLYVAIIMISMPILQ